MFQANLAPRGEVFQLFQGRGARATARIDPLKQPKKSPERGSTAFQGPVNPYGSGSAATLGWYLRAAREGAGIAGGDRGDCRVLAVPARMVEPETARARFQHDVARPGKLYEWFQDPGAGRFRKRENCPIRPG